MPILIPNLYKVRTDTDVAAIRSTIPKTRKKYKYFMHKWFKILSEMFVTYVALKRNFFTHS